jgi:hypothetical protein
MRIKLVLSVGLALTALGVGLVLLGSPVVLASRNGNWPSQGIAAIRHNAHVCQTNEQLPADVSAIGLSMQATLGPMVNLQILSGKRVIAQGSQEAGWDGERVTVPLAHSPPATADATICFKFGSSASKGLQAVDETVLITGQLEPPKVAAISEEGPLEGRLGIEYLRHDGRSWGSQALSVARRLGVTSAEGGAWMAVVAGALMLVAAILGSRSILHELR